MSLIKVSMPQSPVIVRTGGDIGTLTVIAPVSPAVVSVAATLIPGPPGPEGPGLPAGGATGQIPAKASASDYDFIFIDPPSGGGAPAWADITGKPSTFAPVAHGHTAAEITDFSTAADARVSAGIAAHEAAADPHPGYLTPAEGNAASDVDRGQVSVDSGARVVDDRLTGGIRKFAPRLFWLDCA